MLLNNPVIFTQEISSKLIQSEFTTSNCDTFCTLYSIYFKANYMYYLYISGKNIIAMFWFHSYCCCWQIFEASSKRYCIIKFPRLFQAFPTQLRRLRVRTCTEWCFPFPFLYWTSLNIQHKPENNTQLMLAFRKCWYLVFGIVNVFERQWVSQYQGKSFAVMILKHEK